MACVSLQQGSPLAECRSIFPTSTHHHHHTHCGEQAECYDEWWNVDWEDGRQVFLLELSNYVNSHDYYYSSNYYQIPSVYPWSSPTPITFPIKGSNSPNTQTQTLTNSPVSTTSPPLTLPPTSIQPQTIPVSNEGASVASYFPELGPAIPINTTSSLPQIQPQVIQTYVTPSQTIPI